MDTENTIRKMLEEGGVSEQQVQRTLEKFRTIAANSRYDREAVSSWYLIFRDETLAEVLDEGETISAANLRAIAIGGAIDAMEHRYYYTVVADEYLESGEGQFRSNHPTFEDSSDDVQFVLGNRNFRWVRITENKRGRKRARNLATIYLVSDLATDDQGMLIARARKGLPPNPYDTFPIRYRQVDGRPVEADVKTILPDPQGSQGVKGVRATQRVRIEPSEDHDHMWHFPGFKVRSSKLLPVLTGFRDLGKQYIELSEIQAMVQRMAQSPK